MIYLYTMHDFYTGTQKVNSTRPHHTIISVLRTKAQHGCRHTNRASTHRRYLSRIRIKKSSRSLIDRGDREGGTWISVPHFDKGGGGGRFCFITGVSPKRQNGNHPERMHATQAPTRSRDKAGLFFRPPQSRNARETTLQQQ